MNTVSPLVAVKALTFAYSAEDGRVALPVLDRISFAVRPGELLAIVGPSGCGKTTLLQLMAGLLKVQSGSIEFAAPSSRPTRGTACTLVFQDLALFYWMTTRDNLIATLAARGVSRSQRQLQADELLAQFGLAQFGDRYVHHLSGGMRQRLAFARGLATAAPLMLLDEPFSHLDPGTEEWLEQDLLRWFANHSLTVVMVSHDLRRVLRMADRVIVLSPRPAHIAAEVVIDLARPRTPDVVYSPRFIALEQQLCSLLPQPSAP